MTKSIKEAMESAGYEECGYHSNWTLEINEDGECRRFFKKKPEPKVHKIFRDNCYEITVNKYGLTIFNTVEKEDKFGFHEESSLPLLIEAVKYWEANKDD